jgi:hypothetical protein
MVLLTGAACCPAGDEMRTWLKMGDDQMLRYTWGGGEVMKGVLVTM